MSVETVRDQFVALHQRAPRLFRAPGRVNLIGEHTDYNDGFVLPIAIDRDTIVAAAPRKDSVVRVTSLEMDSSHEFSLAASGEPPRGWHAYVEGVAREMQAREPQLGGADLVVGSDLPLGAGLSSSAALEIAVGFALNCVHALGLPPRTLATIGRAAEHHFAGTQCGVMDQLVSACADKGCALLVDCRSLAVENIPAPSGPVCVLVADTGVKHSLAASAYNERRNGCIRATRIFAEHDPGVKALRDVSMEMLERYAPELGELPARRVRHVITENRRTLEAADAMRASDWAALGRLMWESHISLRDDYEVSCVELDAMADAARALDGVFGVRMTGGGFGGSAVILASSESRGRITAQLEAAYLRATQRVAHVFIVTACEGASELPTGQS